MAAKEKKFTFIKIQHVKLQCKKNLLYCMKLKFILVTSDKYYRK